MSLRRFQAMLLTAALCAGYFLILLDVTAVNVALPSIGTALAPGASGLAWVVDAYALPLASLLLVAGGVGDRIGHRRLVLLGLAGFGLASLACALCPSLPLLSLARAVQGAAAALALPGTLAMITDAAPEPGRARAIGTWAAVGAIALPAGPLIGGVLVSLAGWPLIFLINLPIGAVAMIIIARYGPAGRRPPAPTGRLDLAGAVLAVAMLAMITFAVIELRERPLASLIAIMVAVPLALIFVRRERTFDPPLLPLPLLRRPGVASSLITAGVMNLCSLGSLFLLTQWLQTVDHRSPWATGLWLLPAFLPLPLLGRFAGRLTQRYGPGRPATAGLALGALGFGTIAASPSVATPTGVLGLVLWGVGLGLLTPAVVAATVAALPDRPGTAAGLSNTARQLGGALGVAGFGTLAGPATTPAFVPTTRLTLLAAAAAFTLTALKTPPTRH
ncbi:MFS transporter [Microlunatus speluncae]|uniref:MFS transporter n=1 Tax=Microlunatus speluncae TaxID=2594267 RepID=UPI0012663FD3|nr:MFS transporter [Microlunatus speluncae]